MSEPERPRAHDDTESDCRLFRPPVRRRRPARTQLATRVVLRQHSGELATQPSDMRRRPHVAAHTACEPTVRVLAHQVARPLLPGTVGLWSGWRGARAHRTGCARAACHQRLWGRYRGREATAAAPTRAAQHGRPHPANRSVCRHRCRRRGPHACAARHGPHHAQQLRPTQCAKHPMTFAVFPRALPGRARIAASANAQATRPRATRRDATRT